MVVYDTSVDKKDCNIVEDDVPLPWGNQNGVDT